jgi:dipeptidyl aminopeptidase/acylaminoacyl peptidase
MSERKVEQDRAIEEVELAEDVAVSVDEETAQAVDEWADAAEPSADPAEDEVGDVAVEVLEAADMVAEGAPVAEPVERDVADAGDTPSSEETQVVDTEPDETAQETLRATNGREPSVDEQPAAADEEAAAAVATATEEPAEAETEPVEYGPVSDPPQPGPGNPSPDGDTLAFLQADATGETRLWLYAIDGSGGWSMSLPFVPVIDDEGPQWSPDGKWIALTGSHYRGGPTSIWLAPFDGGDCVLLADHDASDRQPRWSPDGTLVAFVSNRDGRDTVCVSLPDGAGPVFQLTYGHPGQDDRDLCWSEDSTRIAFVRRTIDGDTVGDHIWTVSIANGELKQATKKVASRHALRWCPGKTQIAFVTEEGEWRNIGVVNPDNSAGWNLASEAGDKSDPHYSADGTRLLYTRALQGEVRLCERATSGANPDLLDPGMGVVSAPRWLPDKRVVYRFAPATGRPRFIVQEAKKDAERTILPSPVPWQAGHPLIEPTFVEFESAGGAKLGGLYYRDPALTAKAPGIVVVGDRPMERAEAAFQPLDQALAAAGFAVLRPILPGSPGMGRKVTNGLKDSTPSEFEALDLSSAVEALRVMDGVDRRAMSVVGIGFGGALGLLLAGARPGGVDAVIAVDPVTDWDDEFDHGASVWREWHARNLGLPSSRRGVHSLISPTTFAGVISAPLLIVGTDRVGSGRAAQRTTFEALLTELEVSFEAASVGSESWWEIGERTATFIQDRVVTQRPQEPEPQAASESDAEAAAAPEAGRADDV